jgi:hypothetical protein
MNFTEEDPRRLVDISFGFRDLFTRELIIFREFVQHLTKNTRSEVDLFIPAAIIMDSDKIVHAVRALKA